MELFLYALPQFTWLFGFLFCIFFIKTNRQCEYIWYLNMECDYPKRKEKIEVFFTYVAKHNFILFFCIVGVDNLNILFVQKKETKKQLVQYTVGNVVSKKLLNRSKPCQLFLWHLRLPSVDVCIVINFERNSSVLFDSLA